MRPAQVWSPRRSNWSNPKSYNYFVPFFPIREWGAPAARLARRGASFGLSAFRRRSSGSSAKLAAIRRASSTLATLQ